MLFAIIISSSAWSQQIPDSLNIVINTLKESLRDVVEASASEIDRDAEVAVDLLVKEINDSKLILNQANG